MAAVACTAVLVAACGDSGAPGTTAAPPTTTTTVETTTTAPATSSTTTVATTSTSTTVAPTSTTTTVADLTVRIEVSVEQGSVVGGVETFDVPQGAPVAITVTADAADEVHVHGYDRFADVAPGQPAVVEFIADIPGIFEVEMESARLLLLELEVG